MSKINRIKVSIISFIMIVAIIVSVLFIMSESHHDCSGETCQICYNICFCKNIMQALYVLILSIITLIYAQKTININILDIRFSETLIMLKVKLTI